MSAARGMWLTIGAGFEDPAACRAGAAVVNVKNGSSLAACSSSELEPDRKSV